MTYQMTPKFYTDRACIEPFWQDAQFKNRTYTKQPVTDEEVAEWRAMGYTHNSFTGEVHIIKDIQIDVMLPIIAQISSVFDTQMLDIGMTLFVMRTLDIMPVHVDHFRTYMKLFNVERKNIRRCLVMLEDWKPGHYLELDGTSYSNWRKGQCYAWEADTPHAAANIGVEDRYTLQITYHV